MRFQELPHKNVIVSAVVAFIAVSTAFFLTRSEEVFPGEKTLVVQALPEVKNGPEDIDTDYDGLPDWKEKLYNSDIYVADSDGDGVKDGDEVRVGRNPAVPNTAKQGDEVNDKLVYLEDPDIATSSTDLLGIKKEFFARYLAEGAMEIREETFNKLMKSVDAEKFAPQYELLDLSITSDNSAEGIKTYVNAFGIVIEKYLKHPMSKSEDDLIAEALNDKRGGPHDELQLVAIGYKNFAADLLALPVPTALAQAHLLIVNGYEGMGVGLMSVARIQEDPLNGTAGYEAYLKYRLDVTNGYALIVAHIGKERVVFGNTEPGYLFYQHTKPQQ